jgi:PEGA domain-containing protein
MSYSKTFSLVAATVLALAVCQADAWAQSRGHGGHGGGGARGPVAGHAAPRGPYVGGSHAGFPRYNVGYLHPRYISPRIVGVYPYHPYYYPFRPGITVGFYAGFGYGYGYPYGYPYPYPYYGYPYGAPYGYPYASSGYGYGYGDPAPQSYLSAQPGVAYGGIRIEGAPRDAQVFADGNYVGVAEDFDGPVKHLNLPAGSHQIEIRANGAQPIAFDVNVQGGQTVSVHADVR